MKASELRIGNYISYDSEEILLTIVEGMYFGKEYKRNSIITKYVDDFENEFHPIPLNEEWLLKFGFEKDKDFGNWHLNDYEIYTLNSYHLGVKDGSVYFYNYAMDDYYSSTKKLDFVHKLQNHYFVNKDEELEIK